MIDIKGEGLGDFAFDFNGPGASGQTAGVSGGIAFVDSEFIEIVVVGDVGVGRELLAGSGEWAGDGLEFGSGADYGSWGDQLAETIGGEPSYACRGSAFQESATA